MRTSRFATLGPLFALALLADARAASAAERPYATLVDDGMLAADFTKKSSIPEVAEAVLAKYEAAGQKRPDVLSVWTTFPMVRNDIVTFFLPLKNDVRGIGLDGAYGGDGTLDEGLAKPTRAVLLHNNINALPKRAVSNGSPEEGFPEYLFLLELSHLWGPAARVPEKEGLASSALIGFDFHWSFWMDAGGSPAGGNTWRDNKDGTFSTAPLHPRDIKFSMLDLYLMGLAAKEEVPPFGLLTDVEVTSGSTEPMYGGARPVSAVSFPWFQSTPVTVKAKRVAYTVDEVIAASGVRAPAMSAAPKTLTLGIALVVGAGTDDAKRKEYEAMMDGIAPRLAPAFERATGGRGKLEVLSSVITPPAEPDPQPEPAASPPAASPATAGGASDGGCAVTRAGGGAGGNGSGILVALGALGAKSLTRRTRSRASSRTGAGTAFRNS